jgi:NAD(P)-dependent dehydrogenase (short-subunit alcohol dehydrogenase family)
MTTQSMSTLTGRAAIVTGASDGLGRAIAQAYLQSGASVLICARDRDQLEKARVELDALAGSEQVLAALPADVSNPADVERLTAYAFERFSQVHVLVNNAGVYGPIGPVESVDWTEWVRAIEINLHGSALMTRALVPHFKQHHYGKIIQLSGGGATNPLPRFSAYAASKAAVVRFAESLALEVEPFGIDVNAIAPGALNTRMMEQLLATGPETVGPSFYERMKKIADEGGTPLERGAALAVFLASSASDGITGRLLSAVWDSWGDLPARRDQLKRTDVYTLRRITPADRGLDWDKT